MSNAVTKIATRISEMACDVNSSGTPKDWRDQAFELRTLATRLEAQAEMAERDLLEMRR